MNKGLIDEEHAHFWVSEASGLPDYCAKFVDQQCKRDLIELARQHGMRDIDEIMHHACRSNAAQLKAVTEIMDGTRESRTERTKFMGRLFYVQPRLDLAYTLAKFYLHQKRHRYVSPPDSTCRARHH